MPLARRAKAAFDTAALDPIFWLRHCNIDRLWEVWLRRNKSQPNQFSDPSDAAWNTAVSFDLHDEHQNSVSLTPADVRDTKASRFAYKYDDVTDPLGPTLEAAGDPKRTISNIENITADRRANGYAVYVNLPEGGDPTNYRDRFAGNIPLFGIDAKENPDNLHASDGLYYALDITSGSRSSDAWRMESWKLRLTFIPKNRRGGLESAADEVPVQVGRVSLYTE